MRVSGVISALGNMTLPQCNKSHPTAVHICQSVYLYIVAPCSFFVIGAIQIHYDDDDAGVNEQMHTPSAAGSYAARR